MGFLQWRDDLRMSGYRPKILAFEKSWEGASKQKVEATYKAKWDVE